MNLGGLYGEGYALTPGPGVEPWRYRDLFPRHSGRKGGPPTRAQQLQRKKKKQEAKRLRKLRK